MQFCLANLQNLYGSMLNCLFIHLFILLFLPFVVYPVTVMFSEHAVSLILFFVPSSHNFFTSMHKQRWLLVIKNVTKLCLGPVRRGPRPGPEICHNVGRRLET